MKHIKYFLFGCLLILIPLVTMAPYYGQKLGPNDSPTFAGLTVPSITPAANFELNQNSIQPFTSVAASAVDNTLYLKEGKVGIGTTPEYQIHLGGYDALCALTGNSAGFLTHQYLTSGSDCISLAGNFRRTDDTTGTIPLSILGTSEISLKTSVLGGSVGSISFLTGAVNTVPSEKMTILNDGNVGIGTATPEAKLDVHGDVYVGDDNAVNALYISRYAGSGRAFLVAGDKDRDVPVAFTIQTRPDSGVATDAVTVSKDGDMTVAGCIISSGSCADYVFDDDYALPPLDDLHEFVSENRHLPGMTINKGGKISHNNAIHELLVKVEEQSRYIIEMHNRLKKLEDGK